MFPRARPPRVGARRFLWGISGALIRLSLISMSTVLCASSHADRRPLLKDGESVDELRRVGVVGIRFAL